MSTVFADNLPELPPGTQPDPSVAMEPEDFALSEQELIAVASRGRYVDFHCSDHAFALYQEIQDFITDQPPPEPGTELRDAMAEAGVSLPADPAYLPSLTLGTLASSTMSVDFWNVHDACWAAQAQGDQELVKACGALAKLLINTGKTMLN